MYWCGEGVRIMEEYVWNVVTTWREVKGTEWK
jgi:hypothetical protein